MWENLGQKSFRSPTKPLEGDIWLHLDRFLFFLSFDREWWWGWKCWEKIERALYSGLYGNQRGSNGVLKKREQKKKQKKTWELQQTRGLGDRVHAHLADSSQHTLQSQRPRSPAPSLARLHPEPSNKTKIKYSPKNCWKCSENSVALNSEGNLLVCAGRWTGGQNGRTNGNQSSWSAREWGQICPSFRRERNMWSDSGEHFGTEFTCTPRELLFPVKGTKKKKEKK